jgi:rhomboid protease GluP
MSKLAIKIRLVFLPFLLIAVGTITVYTFLHWLLFIKTDFISLNEDIVKFWIPFFLPWLPLFIWFMPRIKLLSFKTKKGNLPWLYLFAATLAIAFPLIIAQEYVQTATGKLTELDNIGQIQKQPATKYYSLKHFYIDKQHIGVQNAFDLSGKNDDDFNMKLFVVLPIYASQADTAKPCLAWYGIRYTKVVSNSLSTKEKEERFKAFQASSQADFDTKNVTLFDYLERLGNTDDRRQYSEAVKDAGGAAGSSTLVLTPVFTPYADRNGNKLAWMLGVFGAGSLVLFVMLVRANVDEEDLENYRSGGVNTDNGLKKSLSLFIPKGDFFITPIIINLNILVFVVMVFAGLGLLSFRADDLVVWGANYRPYTTNGQWWRLLTNIFLHGGLMHVVANMYGLLFVGIFLEPRLGRLRYTLVYLVTGIIASATSLWWHADTVSIGASGAIFGLYGISLAMMLTKVVPGTHSKLLFVSIIVFAGYNLFMGFISSGTDNAAHIGGLVSGFIIGLLLYPQLKKEFTEAPEDELATEEAEEL